MKGYAPEVWRGPDSREKHCWLYCLTEAGFEQAGPCKVGIASHVSKRLSSLQGGNPRKLSLVWKVCLPNRQAAIDVEAHCLIAFRPNPYSSTRAPRLQSEWVDFAPSDVLQRASTYLSAGDCQIEQVA